MTSRLLSPEQVCAMTDVSYDTIKRWIRAGKFPLPLVMPNGLRKWRIVEIEQWIFDRPRAKVEDFAPPVKGKKTHADPRRTTQDHANSGDPEAV